MVGTGKYTTRRWRVKGKSEIVKASCVKQALLKLVDGDGDFTYKPHWYNGKSRLSWAEFETGCGYKGILEELRPCMGGKCEECMGCSWFDWAYKYHHL